MPLAITVKIKESVYITLPTGEEVIIYFADIDKKHSKVTLGFTAPPSITIDREVIHRRKKVDVPR